MSENDAPRPSRPVSPATPRLSRRQVLRAVSATAAVAASGLSMADAQGQPSSQTPSQPPADGEWRNRQADMAYRRLGRTGLMISEVVSGGDPIRPDNFEHLGEALDRGLNYLDMAPAYGNGRCEEAYGAFLAKSSAKRDRIFLTTKVSRFNLLRERMYQEIFDGLPEGKQQAIVDRAEELRRQRAVDKPGYFLTYYPGQQLAFGPAYRRIAMMRDYGHRVEGDPSFAQFITESLEGSLKRIGTDHFDILMCPHGADSPEDLQCPEILEVFETLKRQGKVRFLGVTAHNDPAGVLGEATDAGHYDVVMLAYNVINGGYLERTIRRAHEAGVGVIAMKVAMAVATHHRLLQPVPQRRIDKLNRIVPGDQKPPMKAYTWALQNPNISAVISNLWDQQHVRENLSVAGKSVALSPA